MKYCARHWEQLREAVKECGLWSLVAGSGAEAAMRMQEELINQPEQPPDPLMAAHNMVVARALRYYELSLFGVDDEGKEHCPVCLLLQLPDSQGRDIEGLEQHYSGDLVKYVRENLREWCIACRCLKAECMHRGELGA